MARKTIMEKIVEKFDSQEDCDVTFEVQGKRFQAHMIILVVQKFQFYMKNKDEPVIQVNDVDYVTFHSIVRFVYTEKLDITKENIFKFMHAARVLESSGLAKMCASYLIKMLSIDNFVYLANVAADFANKSFQEKLLHFFKSNMLKIIFDVQFKYLSPEGIALLLSAPPTGNCSELQWFVMLRRWARTECQRQGRNVATGQDIRRVFGENFKALRVPHMNLEDVARLVIGKDILSKDEELSLLHYMSLPSHLQIDFPSETLPFIRPVCQTGGVPHAKIVPEVKQCSLCNTKLDTYFGAEMIHCSQCDFDFCLKCLHSPSHTSHNDFLSVKTVFGMAKDCCNSCGWPVKVNYVYQTAGNATFGFGAIPATGGQASSTTFGGFLAQGASAGFSFTSYPSPTSSGAFGGLGNPSSQACTKPTGFASSFGPSSHPNTSSSFASGINLQKKDERKAPSPDKSQPDDSNRCKNCSHPLKSDIGVTED